MIAHKPITQSTSDRKWRWLARGWLAVGLAVSAVLFVRAMPHSPPRPTSPQAKPATVADDTAAFAQRAAANVGTSTARTETVYGRQLITQPIETIRVGQRVLGTNPNRDEVEEFEEPDPQTWRTIEVEQIKPSGKRLYATLLRSREWIEEELDPKTNTLELDLPELGAEGPAKVLRIGPCPPIASGNGHIVTATFKHEPDGGLLTLTIGDDDIGCTANHPFWSEDRQAFVEAGQLREGERVRTRLDEVAAVVSIKPRPPSAWVYNLEVQGEHVYEVGPGGVLVHNAYNKALAEAGEKWVRQWLEKRGIRIVGTFVNNSGQGIDLIIKTRSGKLIFLEVKTTATKYARGLGKSQRKLAGWEFVEKQLELFGNGKGRYWKLGPGSLTGADATALLEELRKQPGGITSTVVLRVKVTEFDLKAMTGRISFVRWR
jgi:hypothetical protein